MPTPKPSMLSRLLHNRLALKSLAWLLTLALLAALVLQNSAPVQMQLLMITVEMPQILLVLLAAGLGFVLGLMAPALWKGRRSWPRPAAASQWQEDPPGTPQTER
jgi:uncharacterized integral membrane protein